MVLSLGAQYTRARLVRPSIVGRCPVSNQNGMCCAYSEWADDILVR
jgi:hypothetical protein